MNLQIRNLAKKLSGALGEALLTDISNAPWGHPKNQYIEELGISYGHHQGLVRKRNEDRLIIATIQSASGAFFVLAAICDGVGGSEHGDLAAEITIATLVSEIAYTKVKISASEILRHAIRRADEKVRECLNGSGLTTASIILATSGDELISANIGDSRIFTWLADETKKIRQVSIDDTLENELKNLNIKDASALIQKGLLGTLSQAIGETGRGVNELSINIQSGSEFDSKILLATDGAWKNCPDAFHQVALHSKLSADTPKRLIAVANWTGGIDNSSIVLIENKSALLDYCNRSINTESTHLSVKYWFAETKQTYKEIIVPVYPAKDNEPSKNRRIARKPRPKKNQPPNEQLDFSENENSDRGDHRQLERPMVKIIIDSEDEKN